MLSRLGFGGGTPTKRNEETSPVVTPPPTLPPFRPVTPSTPTVTPNGSPGPAKALRLVYTDDKGRFRMDAEAVASLQLVKGPIGVVSVCGRARQGKSFILNQLLGRSSGFQVGPTHRPCTKGLWMWSAPLKRTAPDGTEYNLLLLDSEGIDAYDQTGTYSTKIFSLAVLLSSMFVYNQMGGIDEAALDRLSLVTEVTKHIRVRASQNQASVEELGQFAPVFLWLLRDFYLDLSEDGRKITPRDYLESALQPMTGTGKEVFSKNEIRESIRALFPDRHCFTLVRPVNKEHDLQRLDTIAMDKMRPEFRQGLDNLTKFILERTRPKQVGATVMTGPVLAALTQSFLDAINAGAVPTIATSWQNVEENECRRAYEMALEAYANSFDKSTPADQDRLQEAYDAAVQVSISVYNSEAVGVGPVRLKFEKHLRTAVKKYFEDFKQKASMEAELKCLKAVESMEERLRISSHLSNSSYEQLLGVVNELISQYERDVSGPAKWQKLVKFLQQSLEGPLSDIVKRMMNQAASQVSSLELKCRSFEDRLSLTTRQIETAQRESLDWKRRYEAAIADYKSATELSASQYAAIQSKLSKLEERRGTTSQQLEAAMKDVQEWQSKYDHLAAGQRTDQERFKSEYAALQSRCSAAEARLAAAREQSQGAKEEAAEWRRKHDSVLVEARSTAERYNALRERGSKQSQQREDALRAEFGSSLAQKDVLLAEAHGKLEQSEHLVTDLRARLQAQESKLGVMEASEQDLLAKLELMERRLEEKEHEAEVVLLNSQAQRANTVHVLEGLLESERIAHAEANTRAEGLSVQLQNVQAKLDALQHELATSRLNETAMETKLRTQAESSGRRKRSSEDKGDHDPETLMETTPPTETRSRRKRPRLDVNLETGTNSQVATPGEGESMEEHGSTELRDSQDYKKFTINILKQEITKAGFGAQVLQMRNVPKRDYIALYEKCVLNKE